MLNLKLKLLIIRETNLRKLSRSYHFIKGFFMLDFINNSTKNPFYSKPLKI